MKSDVQQNRQDVVNGGNEPIGLCGRGRPEAEGQHVSIEFGGLRSGVNLEAQFFGKLNRLDLRSADVRIPRDSGLVPLLDGPPSDCSSPESEAWGKSEAHKYICREGNSAVHRQPSWADLVSVHPEDGTARFLTRML